MFKHILILLLCCVFAGFVGFAAAGQKTLYVDTDVSGGNHDGSNWANAFQSMDQLENDAVANLVTDQNNLVVYFRASAGTADTNAVIWNGWTTSYIYDIKLVMDGTNGSDQHDGTWCTDKYRLEVADEYAFYGADDNISLIGLQIRTDSIDGADHVVHFNYQSADSNSYVEQCIIRGVYNDANAQYGISFGDPEGQVYISNNIVYDLNKPSGCYGVVAQGDQVFIYNNTIYGGGRGIVKQATDERDTVVKNNICYGQTAGYCFYSSAGWDANSCNNLSSDTTAPGDANVHSATPSFVDADNDDYHLASNDTSGAKDGGADLDSDPSGFYDITEDIDKEDRDDAGTWDIGADEYVAEAGGGGTPLRKKQIHFGKKD